MNRRLDKWTPVLPVLMLMLALGVAFPPAADACGGSRAGLCTWSLTPLQAGLQSVSAEIQSGVRGSTYADVKVISPTQMQAHWVSGELDGHIPGLGDIRLDFQKKRPSVVNIDSLQEGGVPFFPARAVQELYYRLRVFDDHGNVVRTLYNLKPMVMEAEITSIPPYGSEFEVMDVVDFYDISGKDPVSVVRLHVGSTGWLDNSGGINVRLVDQNIDYKQGTFELTWELEGNRAADVPARWLANGLHGAEVTSLVSSGEVYLAADQAAHGITLRGTFDVNNLDAGLALHAFATEGESLEGHKVFSFYEIARANR